MNAGQTCVAPDYLFLPMLRNIPKVADEETSKLCPIVQGSADMLKWDGACVVHEEFKSQALFDLKTRYA